LTDKKSSKINMLTKLPIFYANGTNARIAARNSRPAGFFSTKFSTGSVDIQIAHHRRSCDTWGCWRNRSLDEWSIANGASAAQVWMSDGGRH
jgi:hypothetical protein